MQLNDTLILRLNMDARVAGPFCYWVRVFYLAHTLMRVSVNKSMHVITYNTDSKGGGGYSMHFNTQVITVFSLPNIQPNE